MLLKKLKFLRTIKLERRDIETNRDIVEYQVENQTKILKICRDVPNLTTVFILLLMKLSKCLSIHNKKNLNMYC